MNTKQADRTAYDVQRSCRTEPVTWCCGWTSMVMLRWR